MKINYNIAGINIGVDSDFTYEQDERFYKFISKKESKSDINVKMIKQTMDVSDKYKNVFNRVDYKIYIKDDVFYRQHYVANKRGVLSCFIQKKQDDELYYCYVNSNLHYKTHNIFSMIGFEYLLNLKGAIILHSSQILYNGKSILFSAPSQTGKSTQADLWVEYENAELINGDRSAIRKVDGVWRSYGLPYAGSSNIYKNIASPIGAIIILRQGKKNGIRKATKMEAFKYLYSETTVNIWDEEFINRTSNIIEGLINEVPIYMYYCLPDKSAVDKLKGVLEEEVYGTTTNNEVFI